MNIILTIALALLDQTKTESTLDTIYKAVITILLGGLSGAFVNAFNARSIEKDKRSIELVKDYFSFRSKIGEARGYLQNPDSFIANKAIAQNLINESADRLNYIADLYNNKLLTQRIIDS